MPVDGAWPLVAVPAVALAALLTRATTAGGAAAGTLVGLALAAGAGWAGFLMLATMLVLGTLASAREERGRDAIQVFSCGSVAAAAALAAGSGAPWGAAAAAGALATVLSDTVSAELGRRFGGTPRALLLGPPLPAGADGAMSPIGTLLGAVAALPVPLVGLAAGTLPDARAVLAIAGAAFAGNLADSALGLALQRRLGRRGNDWVNVGATLCGASLAAIV